MASLDAPQESKSCLAALRQGKQAQPLWGEVP